MILVLRLQPTPLLLLLLQVKLMLQISITWNYLTNVITKQGRVGGPGPMPPTTEGPPTKLLIFYFLLMNQLITSLQMLCCYLQVLLCTEIAAQEDFAPAPIMTSGGT